MKNIRFSFFIISEIPNIIQIIAVPSLLGILLKLYFFQFIVPIFVGATLWMYLTVKSKSNKEWEGKISMVTIIGLISCLLMLVGLYGKF